VRLSVVRNAADNCPIVKEVAISVFPILRPPLFAVDPNAALQEAVTKWVVGGCEKGGLGCPCRAESCAGVSPNSKCVVDTGSQ